MPEEVGLILNLIPKLNSTDVQTVKRQLGGGGLLGNITTGMGLGVGMQIMQGVKDGVMGLLNIFKQSSPLLQRSLKMIQIAILSIVRPIADTFGRILQPISRFFMMWGRAIYADYRKKYKENVAAGMSPIEASINASVQSFVDGITGLFTGKIGDVDLHTTLQTIVDEIGTGIIKGLGTIDWGGLLVGFGKQLVDTLMHSITGGMLGSAVPTEEKGKSALDQISGIIQGSLFQGLLGPAFPKMQGGGIVTKPTFGMIGEKGAEAIIPLNKLGGLGGPNVNITISGNTFTKEIDLERAVRSALDDYVRSFQRGR